jgi:hypothetical protein
MTKQSLLIVGYYHLADGFRTCANFLEKTYNVYFFPFCHYVDNKYDVMSELTRYINGDKCDHYECGLIENHQTIDIVLLWNHKYFIDNSGIFITMKENMRHKVIYLGYNWDPVIEISMSKILFIRALNGYLSCDGSEVKYLTDHGEYNSVYCPPGFDPKVTFYKYDPSKQCDVSIVCTNLYSDCGTFKPRVHRKELVDSLYGQRNEINLHIYGPVNFKEIYPDCYKGYIAYEECPKVFSNSKINLCIHATSYNNHGKHIYFSERLPQILGSHGLLYCDTEYDYLLRPDVNYVLADSNDQLGQIRSILKNYDNPKYQIMRDKGHELSLQNFTWSNMLNQINMITHNK